MTNIRSPEKNRNVILNIRKRYFWTQELPTRAKSKEQRAKRSKAKQASKQGKNGIKGSTDKRKIHRNTEKYKKNLNRQAKWQTTT